MQNPRVAQLIQDGARDRDPELRKACIDQLSIILTGERLREVAAELLRQETHPELRTRLERLSRDVDWDGTEEEKNRALAPLDKVPEEFSEMQLPEVDGLKPVSQDLANIERVSTTDRTLPPRSGEVETIREGHKEESGRRAARKQDERDF